MIATAHYNRCSERFRRNVCTVISYGRTIRANLVAGQMKGLPR